VNFQPATISSWAIVSFGRNIQANIGGFVEEVCNGLDAVGIKLPSEYPVQLTGNTQGDIDCIIREAMAKAEHTFGSRCELIIAILDTPNSPLYHALKAASDVSVGVALQVVTAGKALKPRGQAQYVANVALKI
jgi:hypothetical protein